MIGLVTIAALIVSRLRVRRELLAGSRGDSPIVLVIVGVLILAYSFLMGRTVFGRHVYAIGGNLHAAILSGVNTRRVNLWIFVNIGILAGVAPW